MAAINDVARLAGVSKSTASRALSGGGYVSAETKAKVRAAAAQIGYVASSNAASLVTGRTRNVGVVIPYISRWFFAEVLDGIESCLIQAGYDLTLYRLREDVDQRRRVFDYFLIRKRVDAVLSVGLELSPEEIVMLSALGKPVVCIGGPTEGIDSLRIDDIEVTERVTKHLIDLGHRRILHIGGDQKHQMDFRTHSERLAGFRRAMAAAGISPSDDFRAADFSIPGGYAVALSALVDPQHRPTAIVAACDEVAIGTILAARQLGIQIPAELSVVGIDDHQLSELFGLTTIRQDPEYQGELAVSLLMRRLGEATEFIEPARDETGSMRIPTTLVIRSSTAPPAG
jgi:DNA-binding LacI/PurR family transcriptional regulator